MPCVGVAKRRADAMDCDRKQCVGDRLVLLDSNPLEIRWFSPTIEVDLCGHATLATARILFDEYLPATETTIIFRYKGGIIEARTEGNLIYLDFPTDEPKRVKNISISYVFINIVY